MSYMDIQFHTNNTFTAKIGPNLLKQVTGEFKGDQAKVNKFANLFNSAHANILDADTFVDITGSNHYTFYHSSFPNIQYHAESIIVRNDKPLTERLIHECSRVLGQGEKMLFQEITRLNKTNIDNLEEVVKNSVKSPKSQERFLEIIDCAKRLLQEDPNSKLKNVDFAIMENIIIGERASTPGTREYQILQKLLNNFDL